MNPLYFIITSAITLPIAVFWLIRSIQESNDIHKKTIDSIEEKCKEQAQEAKCARETIRTTVRELSITRDDLP